MNQYTSNEWVRVSDYTDPPQMLATEELRALHIVWEEQKEKIGSASTYDQFETELKREWAVETGLIERLYTLDPEITQLLITNGIVADFIPSSVAQDAKREELIIRDHESALDHLFSFVKLVRELSPSYVKELHSLITRHQETCDAIDQF